MFISTLLNAVDEVQRLSSHFELVLKRLENLEKDNQRLKVKNAELSTKTLKLEKSNLVLVEKLEKMNKSIKTIMNLNPTIAGKERDDVRLKSGKRLLIGGGKNATGQVGFTAVLTHDLTLGPLQTLEYDKVHTNIGNGYDARHGYFTVPVSGLYIVSATSCSGASQGVRTEIVRNGIQLAALYGDDYDLASHTIVVSLEQNDEVWVRHFAEGTSTVHAGGNRYYSSFSGVLIAAF
ncbi:C1QL [Mytilus coruscus]|uniref:C1QL n=1 Tax=Mytilus coruscus TaxID=42192 RepID=A0A6J8CYU9_MYTCO|nr:C1QL [Mytilus coruscus]